MKTKVSTVLDENLFRRTKLEAVREGCQISAVISAALVRYLDERQVPLGAGSVVEATWGALTLDAGEVVRVLEEEDGLFDA